MAGNRAAYALDPRRLGIDGVVEGERPFEQAAGDLAAVGRVAGKAFIYFLFFSTLALIVGLIVANVVQPGAGLNIDPATLPLIAPGTRLGP